MVCAGSRDEADELLNNIRKTKEPFRVPTGTGYVTLTRYTTPVSCSACQVECTPNTRSVFEPFVNVARCYIVSHTCPGCGHTYLWPDRQVDPEGTIWD